jgi:hypothetical protein
MSYVPLCFCCGRDSVNTEHVCCTLNNCAAAAAAPQQFVTQLPTATLRPLYEAGTQTVQLIPRYRKKISGAA